MSILVINPNSNREVTEKMSLALDRFNLDGGPDITCVTEPAGPFGVETDDHIRQVIPLIEKRIGSDKKHAAYVIACYSDPGLDQCRRLTPKPVFGIQECGILQALSRARSFGVIALSEASIRRHLSYIDHLGFMEQLVAERPAHLTVEQSASGSDTFDILCEVGTQLRDQDGAQSVILGCAGMARHRSLLQEFLGVPVIDPVQAAVTMAMGAILSA